VVERIQSQVGEEPGHFQPFLLGHQAPVRVVQLDEPIGSRHRVLGHLEGVELGGLIRPLRRPGRDEAKPERVGLRHFKGIERPEIFRFAEQVGEVAVHASDLGRRLPRGTFGHHLAALEQGLGCAPAGLCPRRLPRCLDTHHGLFALGILEVTSDM
jgi:hypothetical protein